MPASEVLSGTGDPNGVQHGNPGDLYQDQTGKLWINTVAPTTWVQLATGTGDTSQRFNWIVNGTEGSTFIVTLPVPQPDNQYVVEVTNQGVADPGTASSVPDSGKTTTQFTVNTNNFVNGGDTFGIYVNTKTAPDNTPAPRVDSYSQPSGQPGDVIQVFGQFFTGATAVDVNGTNAPIFTVDTDTQITMTLPAGFTTGPIDVTTPAGTGSGPPFILSSWVNRHMNVARESFASGVLLDGRLIAAGGAPNGSSVGPYLASVEIYDPTTQVWSLVAPLPANRAYPLGCVLPDGRFLVAGGQDDTNTTLTSALIYDPVGNTWTPTGAMTQPRVATGGFLTPITSGPNAGNVLCPFGADGHGVFYNQSEIYNVGAGTWGQVASTGARFDATTIGLTGGNVLAVGARTLSAPIGNEIHTALWTAATNTWANKADMPVAQFQPGLVQLNAGPVAGQVVAAGGTDNSSHTSFPDVNLYDPVGDAWVSLPAMAVPRSEFAFGYMSDGRIIAAGGVWLGNGLQTVVQFFNQTSVDWDNGPDLNIGQGTAFSFGGEGPIPVNGFYAIFGGATTATGGIATDLTQVYVGPP